MGFAAGSAGVPCEGEKRPRRPTPRRFIGLLGDPRLFIVFSFKKTMGFAGGSKMHLAGPGSFVQ